jgi:hypothetical protein
MPFQVRGKVVVSLMEKVEVLGVIRMLLLRDALFVKRVLRMMDGIGGANARYLIQLQRLERRISNG